MEASLEEQDLMHLRLDNSVIFTSKNELQPGDIVKVKINDAFDYDIIGEEL